MNIKIIRIQGIFMLRSLKLVIYTAHKCLNANNGWHFNSYEQDEFHAGLS